MSLPAMVALFAVVIVTAWAVGLLYLRPPERPPPAPPAHAIGQRTGSFGTGYFAVVSLGRYRVVDVPLTQGLDEGWEFCSPAEARAYIVKLEGGRITSTMFRLL